MVGLCSSVEICVAICVCLCMKVSHKCVRKGINGSVCLHMHENVFAGAMYGRICA